MRLPRLCGGMGLIGEVAMPKLVAQLPVCDLPVLDRYDEIVARASEMLADGLPIIRDHSNFHFRCSESRLSGRPNAFRHIRYLAGRCPSVVVE